MANIDLELAFLRDAQDYDGETAREAICNALTLIEQERMYPPETLNVTENGEYIAEEDHAYNKINVDVGTIGRLCDGVADRFEITENGTYYSKDLFGKDLLIQEFDVNVEQLTKVLSILNVRGNGTYSPSSENELFGMVNVNVPNAPKPGDYLTASMYFLDPTNPNDATMIFIDKDEHILFGKSARQFLDRFPKFRNVGNYVHSDWNPNPDVMQNDQAFIPNWVYDSSGALTPPTIDIDYDVFIYIVQHKVLQYFFDLEAPIRVVIEGITRELNCFNSGYIDADGNETHYGFYISSYDENAATYQYMLNELTSKWHFFNWVGLNDFDGKYIWTDGTDIYYSHNDEHYVLDVLNHEWSPKTWYGLTEFNGNNIWTDGTDIYYSYHPYTSLNVQYVLDKLTSTWIEKTWYKSPNYEGAYVWTDGTDIYATKYQASNNKYSYILDKLTGTWHDQVWNGLNSESGYDRNNFWTDGVDIYYSKGTGHQYILDKATSTWTAVTWSSSFKNVFGADIWTDGINTYYSNSSNQYVFNKANNSWDAKTWTGVSGLYGRGIWTDGTDIYYSYGASSSYQKVLDVLTSTWSNKTWTGSTPTYGAYIWTDGTDIYYSDGSRQLVLDQTTSKWNNKTWAGITNFSRSNIWYEGSNVYLSMANKQYVLDSANLAWVEKAWYSDSDNVIYGIDASRVWNDGNIYYYSNGSSEQYVLDISHSTWISKIWNGIDRVSSFNGEYVWTDGTDIFYSWGDGYHYKLDRSTSTWNAVVWTGYTNFYGSYIWKDNGHIYYSHTYQYEIDTTNLNVIDKDWHGFIPEGEQIWTDGTDIYYSSTEANYKNPKFCAFDRENIDSQTPSEGNNFFWWGCSLARAQVNKRRDYLVRQPDMEVYDNANWDVDRAIPQTLMNDIIPVSHYITHPVKNPNNYTFRQKTIPRKNLSIVQSDDTYEKVENPTGNPRDQGWYNYNTSTKVFTLTTDTTVRSGKTYYFLRSGYDIEVDAPIISDQLHSANYSDVIKQRTCWSDFDLNLKHSPFLYIQSVSGGYVAYKKVEGTNVAYSIEDHIKYARTHAYDISNDRLMRYWGMYGVCKKIQITEELADEPPINTEDIYYMGLQSNVPKCAYLYDKENRVYYTFNPSLNDEEAAKDACVRFDFEHNPSIIEDIEDKIDDGTYLRIFKRYSYTEDTHHYVPEYDIWPDEEHYEYGSGEYFEENNAGMPHVNPDTGEEYTVDFFYALTEEDPISDFYFFNYFDVENGFNTCISSYHYVKSDDRYVLERVSTQYSGHTSENVIYDVRYVREKITDKILVDGLSGNDQSDSFDFYAPPYYGFKGTYDFVETLVDNIINTPLIETIPILSDVIDTGERNKKDIITTTAREALCTYITDERNFNRNIWADDATVKAFDDRRAANEEDPGTYPLYDYETATHMWQDIYNDFTIDYTLLGPHNSYSKTGDVATYDYLYFYL